MAKTVNLTAVEKISTYDDNTNIIVEQDGELNRFAITDLEGNFSEGVSSWNDLTDKPFGEILEGNDTVTWDGNTDGYYVVDNYIKVSDAIPTIADITNGYEYLYSNEQYQLDEYYETENYIDLADSFVKIIKQACTIGSDVFEETGTYFTISDGLVGLCIPNYTGFTITTIKTIDSKYLPEIVPSVTSEDNGKFLRVVNGTWAAASVPNAEEASF